MPIPFERFRLLNGATGHRVTSAKYARGKTAQMIPLDVNPGGPLYDEQVVVDPAGPPLPEGGVVEHVPTAIGYFTEDVKCLAITELIIDKVAGNDVYTFPTWDLFYPGEAEMPDANSISNVELLVQHLDLAASAVGMYARATVNFMDGTEGVYYSPIVVAD